MAQEDNDTIEGWNFYKATSGSWRHDRDVTAYIDVSVPNNIIQVTCSEDYGQSTQKTSVNIPLEVMARIMRQAGYVVKKSDK